MTALLLAACDLPSAPPRWSTTWAAPAKETSIAVADILPADVRVRGDAFEVTIAPASVSRSLGELCSACAAVNGVTVPKPPFSASLEATFSLPTTVASATLGADNVLHVAIEHSFDFDPLRPSTDPLAPRGSLTIELLEGGRLLKGQTISGDTVAMLAGQPWATSFELPDTLVIDGPLTLRTTITSPAGDPVQISANQQLEVSGSIGELRITRAAVHIASQAIGTSTELNLSDIDEGIARRAQSAELRLSVANPFSVTGTMSVDFGVSAVARKSFVLAAASGSPAQDVTLTLTGDEVRAIFGRSLTLDVSGTVNSAGGPVVVLPHQQLTVSGRVFATLLLPTAN